MRGNIRNIATVTPGEPDAGPVRGDFTWPQPHSSLPLPAGCTFRDLKGKLLTFPSKWRAALGPGRVANVAVIGDSLTSGFLWPFFQGWMDDIRFQLQDRYGNAGYGACIIQPNGPRWFNKSGTWTQRTASGVCQQCWETGAASTWQVTVPNCDTLDIIYHDFAVAPTQGNLRIQIDGAAAQDVVQTIANDSTQKLATVTLPSRGEHTITFVPPTVGAYRISGVIARNANASGIRVHNVAVDGTGSSLWNAASSKEVLSLLKPDLVIVFLGAAEWLLQPSRVAEQLFISAIAQSFQANGWESLWILPPGISGAEVTTLKQTDIEADYISIARDFLGVPSLNLRLACGEYAQNSAEGLTFDNVHPSQPGQYNMANAIWRFLAYSMGVHRPTP